MRITLNYKETKTKGRLICLMRAEQREEYAVNEGLFMKWPGWHHKIHSEELCVQSSTNAPVASKHATRRVAACAGSMRVMDAADVGGDPVLDPLVE